LGGAAEVGVAVGARVGKMLGEGGGVAVEGSAVTDGVGDAS
jgi:hypothetical protein